eukprot:GGOE01058888.1.p1 GENE.GGOE01058888.1~~GGOE01058888.1.p1  ORF type:complete len:303 (+),score=82.95 GGOE01058888.1:703-1611(+)
MALVEACSAAVGTTVATLLFYPVDLVKTRVQAKVGSDDDQQPAHAMAVVQDILHRDGPLGLYRGLPQYLLKDIVTTASLFFWKQLVADIYRKRVNPHPGLAEDLLIGVVGGSVTQMLVLPTDRVIVRLQVDPAQPSVLQVIRSIHREGGLDAFWIGLAPSLLLTCNPAITFTAFDLLKRRAAALLRRSPATLSALQTFLLASVAKALALLLTYPLIRARVVMLAQLRQETGEFSSTSRPSRRPSLWHMLRILSEILRLEGFDGLYKGFAAQFWLSILSSGMLLVVRDRILRIVRALLRVAPS